mmetsp:Transcript_29726/g.64906  ORF Transcript_29726/g.64906 Transcript_29726/m.64906 type:complete len:394 (-) Transcript_29726:351-1532(-)|eukprot:CAMPEP_0118931400 /NCGR_PEP_ID=MMETSP1169-20130426/7757_1 /TAXON_ID=36882 /ORGANISM="Pyramimonas obovata, Strain CCMP722" /LENGTH=393 /DNA_ID=CAMNT_0006873899 /DNA_START=332 /DNA_END=1513 /DNA_ORIENTATION=+
MENALTKPLLPSLPPEEPSPERLPPFFWLMLRGCDLLEPPKQPVARPSKIVLLHGWLQDHSCWLNTATKLRHTFGHDVLLMDFYGHGHSPYLNNFYHMNVFTSMRQLRKLVEHVGWANEKLVLAGLSFGGGVAQHYALRYPENVERMILLGSVGAPEPTWRLVPILTRGLGQLLRPLFPWNSDPENYQPPAKVNMLTRVRGKLWIARLYSDHGLPPEMPEFLRRYPLTLVWGRYDTLHSPNLKRWLCKDTETPRKQDAINNSPQREQEDASASQEAMATPSGPRTDVNILIVNMDHVAFCLRLGSLKLHRYPHFWHSCDNLDSENFSSVSAKASDLADSSKSSSTTIDTLQMATADELTAPASRSARSPRIRPQSPSSPGVILSPPPMFGSKL